MTRVLSGIQPSGPPHLGNYLGALRQWVEDEKTHDAFYCIVDLHAHTLEVDPQELRRFSIETTIGLLASGLSPERSTLFMQSHVPAHAELAWLLECTASFGELRRMTQFKDKAQGQEQVRVALFTYPVLMAADILLYDADRVPVGDDQRQHLELTRTLATRFNSRYGETFVLPEGFTPKVGARIMDLQLPERKMSKSNPSDQGRIDLSDPPEVITRKIRRAVTDTETEVRYDPAKKPGVSNLLEILGAATHQDPATIAAQYQDYGSLKKEVAEATVELLSPIQDRIRDLSKDPEAVAAVLDEGAQKARAVANLTIERARDAMGLLPRHF